MSVRVNLFGPLKDGAGAPFIEIPHAPGMTAATSRDAALDLLRGKLAQVPRQVLVAGEREFLKEDAPVADGDTIYLLPPFGGG